jgi:hypothetical protein
MSRLISTVKIISDYQLNNIDQFLPGDSLHVCDCINEEGFKRLIGNKGLPDYFISDCYGVIGMDLGCKALTIPLFFEIVASKFKNVVFSSSIQTTHCANFMINKKQINRQLLIKLVESYQISVNYTWSGDGVEIDNSQAMKELELEGNQSWWKESNLGFLFAPIALLPKWLEIEKPSPPSNGNPMNAVSWCKLAWHGGLNNIFSSSAISLISESVSFQKCSTLTEKTLYSVLGLTFPIWIGGYNQALSMKNLGFDIFEDIIDHSYQNYPSVVERCWWAFALNLHVLRDKNLAAELRIKHKDRLLANRQYALSNQLQQHNDATIATWPTPAQDHARQMVTRYRSLIHQYDN